MFAPSVKDYELIFWNKYREFEDLQNKDPDNPRLKSLLTECEDLNCKISEMVLEAVK